MKKFVLIIFVLIIFGIFSFFIYNAKNNHLELDCKDCNLIIISLTNTRKDHLGLYGYSRETSPNIDKFFKNSIVFDQAFAPSSWTLPNAVSLFTSLYPWEHEVINRYKNKKISSDVISLTEILNESGYKTAAFTGGGDYSRFYGLDKGFDFYKDDNDFSKITEQKEEIISWLKKNQKEKFFLFIQGFDNHCPFNPPDPYNNKFGDTHLTFNKNECLWNLSKDSKNDNDYSVYYRDSQSKEAVLKKVSREDKEKIIKLYDGAISYGDNELSNIFLEINKLGLNKNTIIVFLSEHGDLLGEKGRFMRTDILGSFQDVVLKIPLAIKHPKVKEKKKVEGLVQLIDIAPTVLNLLSVSSDKASFKGRDISSLFKDGSGINKYIYGGLDYGGTEDSRLFNDIRRASFIRSSENKLIREQTFSLDNQILIEERIDLYDIKNDPGELNNLAKDKHYQDIFLELKNELDRWEDSFNKKE